MGNRILQGRKCAGPRGRRRVLEDQIPQAEVDFWLDEAVMSRAPADAQPFFKMAQAATKPYANRIRRISGNVDIFPGISPVAQPGHTPGHTGYIVSSGSDSLWIWGDIVHAMVLQIAH